MNRQPNLWRTRRKSSFKATIICKIQLRTDSVKNWKKKCCCLPAKIQDATQHRTPESLSSLPGYRRTETNGLAPQRQCRVKEFRELKRKDHWNLLESLPLLWVGDKQLNRCWPECTKLKSCRLWNLRLHLKREEFCIAVTFCIPQVPTILFKPPEAPWIC